MHESNPNAEKLQQANNCNTATTTLPGDRPATKKLGAVKPTGRFSAGLYGIRTGQPLRRTRRKPPPAPPRRKPYRKHHLGKGVIPADRLPPAPRWIASMLPAHVLTTLEVLSLLTQGGLVSVTIAKIASGRGKCASTVRNHLRILRMALVICTVEHPAEHNYNGPNSFIFLTLDPHKDTHVFTNCRGVQFVFKASTIYTLLREKLSYEGETKAKLSEARRKWDERNKENHPKWFKNDWYARKKERREKNKRPEVRQKYKEQGEAWNRVDAWRAENPLSTRRDRAGRVWNFTKVFMQRAKEIERAMSPKDREDPKAYFLARAAAMDEERD
jgi:hypothetical protein